MVGSHSLLAIDRILFLFDNFHNHNKDLILPLVSFLNFHPLQIVVEKMDTMDNFLKHFVKMIGYLLNFVMLRYCI